MNENTNPSPKRERSPRRRTIVLTSAVGVAGLVIGGVTAGAISAASADSGTPRENASYSADHRGGQDRGEARGPHGNEEPLTGTKKTKVEDAVRAKYPDATIERVETDSEGVYEAHIVDDDKPLVVKLDKDFKIIGTEELGGPGGHGRPGRGGPGGPGCDEDGAGPGGPGTQQGEPGGQKDGQKDGQSGARTPDAPSGGSTALNS